MHNDPVLQLNVESVYESFDGVPVVRRYARVTNAGMAAAGIEFLSSAMLHGLAAPEDFDRELRIHVAVNSWIAEGHLKNRTDSATIAVSKTVLVSTSTHLECNSFRLQ